MDATPETVLARTQAWLEKAVIGLDLCPFAKGVHVKKQIKYVVSEAKTAESLLLDLGQEFATLIATDPKDTETTLVIHPYVLGEFLDYNDFIGDVDRLLVQMDLEGEIQIATFHPYYQFEGTQPDAIENYTNRSPYPTIQLLREASVEKALESFGDANAIFEKNIETMSHFGHTGWKKLQI